MTVWIKPGPHVTESIHLSPPAVRAVCVHTDSQSRDVQILAFAGRSAGRIDRLRALPLTCWLTLGYQFLFLCAAGAADGLRSAAVDQRKGVLFCFDRRFAESPQTELFRCAIQVEPWCTGERAAGSGSRIPKCGCPVTHHVPTTASSTTTSPAAASGAGTNGNLWTTGHQQGNKHCH